MTALSAARCDAWKVLISRSIVSMSCLPQSIFHSRSDVIFSDALPPPSCIVCAAWLADSLEFRLPPIHALFFHPVAPNSSHCKAGSVTPWINLVYLPVFQSNSTPWHCLITCMQFVLGTTFRRRGPRNLLQSKNQFQSTSPSPPPFSNMTCARPWG